MLSVCSLQKSDTFGKKIKNPGQIPEGVPATLSGVFYEGIALKALDELSKHSKNLAKFFQITLKEVLKRAPKKFIFDIFKEFQK